MSGQFITEAKAGQGRKLWAWALALSLSLNFLLGLGTVWINMQRTRLGYELGPLQRKLAGISAHTAKLEVERDILLSPQYLEGKGRELGLRNPWPGQIRRMH